MIASTMNEDRMGVFQFEPPEKQRADDDTVVDAEIPDIIGIVRGVATGSGTENTEINY
jgi:hypothetical protein